ncbi:hypothetical protein [Vreelandella sp. EE22]
MIKPVEDKDFDLVSALYHASQGANQCSQYCSDVQENADQGASAFFEGAANQYNDIA